MKDQWRRADAQTRRRRDIDEDEASAVNDDPRRISVSPRLRVASSPLIIGHRGASAVAPENTLAAFKRALDDGADGLEFDVRLARDRVPVVIHDATLRRTALIAGSIATLSSVELARVDVGTWFNLRFAALAQAAYSNERIATLEATVETLRGEIAELRQQFDDFKKQFE